MPLAGRAASVPSSQGGDATDARTVDSRDLWREAAGSPANQGYHYNHNAETYMEVGLRPGWATAGLLENKK